MFIRRSTTFTAILMCLPLSSYAVDTGDAPASYGSAIHAVHTDGPYLGAMPPDNNADVSSADAQGDDVASSDGTTAVDDEDGVLVQATLVQNAQTYSLNVMASNPNSLPATLVGWVDFDGSGQFDADEAALATIPAGASDLSVKLVWSDLVRSGAFSGFVGRTYSRLRISTDTLTANHMVAEKSNGEVEDYALSLELDTDGDGIPDSVDTDNDNDGIADRVEGLTEDTDSDGTPNYLDIDADDDGIPDFVEVGGDLQHPKDTDADGVADYLDIDSNNDGVPDSQRSGNDTDGDGIVDALEGLLDSDADGITNALDLDSDNDAIPDAIEVGDAPASPVDSDLDGVADFQDLDSDNDGIPDIQESHSGEISVDLLDTDNNGRVDSELAFGADGFANVLETIDDSGVPTYAVPDTDGDGIRDYRDIDSDNDEVADVLEAGGADQDNNGWVDALVDNDFDGIPDVYDVDHTGGNDSDADNIDDSVDADFVTGADADADGVIDTADLDINSDGLIDDISNDLYSLGYLPDVDQDHILDFRDADSIGVSNLNVEVGAAHTIDTVMGPSVPNNGQSGSDTEIGANSGSGCSLLKTVGKSDPMLLLLLALSLFVSFFRRTRSLFEH